jgi:phage terminase large subunit-like protein
MALAVKAKPKKKTTASSKAKPKRSRGSSKSDPPAPPTRRTRGAYVCRWIETHCVFTQGEWIGKKFRLLPWQRKLIYELFELRPDGLRRYRWALWGVPKKNGKTELAAALGLYFLIGDGEPSPLVACAASTDDQADLVFGAAKRMCELSPTLSQITERFDKEILVPSIPGAALKRVAAVAGANDGPNWYVVICDELHEWKGAEDDTVGRKGRDCWNVLTNGVGARRQPMILQVTTAGFDPETVCYEQYDHCQKIRKGEIDDDRYHFFWVEPPEDADYRDPKVWEAANPSYGVTVRREFYEDQLFKKTESVFRRYFLNQWTESDKSWLPAGAWKACEKPGVVIPDQAQVHLVVDIGLKKDRSAVVTLWNDGERVVAKAHIWDQPPKGQIFDLSKVEQFTRDQADRYEVLGVVYDKWSFERSAQMLSDEGLVMIEFPMTNERTAPASSNLYEAILRKGVVHDGDPKFAAHVAAGKMKDTERGQRLTKATLKRPVDALIALMMGLGSAVQAAGGSGGGGVEWF